MHRVLSTFGLALPKLFSFNGMCKNEIVSCITCQLLYLYFMAYKQWVKCIVFWKIGYAQHY